MFPVTRFFLDARTATPHFPGIGRYVHGLVGALPAQLRPDERLTLLVDPAASDAVVWAAETTVLSVPASHFGLSQQWRLPPVLKGADLYHSPYFLMPYRPGVPTVLTVYDLIPHLLPQSVSLRARLVFHLALRLALRTSARVIAISDTTRTDLLAGFPRLDPDRVLAVPLAPDVRFRPQSAAEIDRIRRLHGLPEDFGLYVGINKPHKNLVRLVEAWAGLEAAPPLVIAGAWDDRYPEAHRAAGSQPPGRIRFLGRIPDNDLPALYSACRLFVFPSLYEGFGLPVVEALSCGAAVACSGTSSLPEVGGAAAVYFDPRDPGSIRQAVADALAAPPDPERSIRQAARFSWSATAAATLEIYRSVAYNGP
jgi:alpha-1,3-rhamnosyl/mannosyltransferase